MRFIFFTLLIDVTGVPVIDTQVASALLQLARMVGLLGSRTVLVGVRPEIVKRLEEERKSAGGIVIPDTAAEKPSMGEVVAAGPGKTDDSGKLVAMGVKVGDKILFGKYSGQEFKLEGSDLLHMREDDVIGVIA